MARLIQEDYREFFNSYIQCVLKNFNKIHNKNCKCQNISTTALIELDKDCTNFFIENECEIALLNVSYSYLAECFCKNEKTVDMNNFTLFNTGNKGLYIEDHELHVSHET